MRRRPPIGVAAAVGLVLAVAHPAPAAAAGFEHPVGEPFELEMTGGVARLTLTEFGDRHATVVGTLRDTECDGYWVHAHVLTNMGAGTGFGAPPGQDTTQRTRSIDVRECGTERRIEMRHRRDDGRDFRHLGVCVTLDRWVGDNWDGTCEDLWSAP